MHDDEFIQLKPQTPKEHGLEVDPELERLFRLQETYSGTSARGGGDDWDAPFDLRVARPRAVDLRKLWQLTGKPEPPGITATLGPRIPILLSHVVAPFPVDGRIPGRVWGLGYEFVAHDVDASTVSVVPDDEILKIGSIGQCVDLGLELGGKIGIPPAEFESVGVGPSVSLTGGALRASMSERFQFALQLRITLRKVIGAPVGIGGAQWKLYRQNEPIDQPHSLLQTLVVAEGTKTIRCTVKTWASQAGWLGTSWGARFWPYADQDFEVSLAGL